MTTEKQIEELRYVSEFKNGEERTTERLRDEISNCMSSIEVVKEYIEEKEADNEENLGNIGYYKREVDKGIKAIADFENGLTILIDYHRDLQEELKTKGGANRDGFEA